MEVSRRRAPSLTRRARARPAAPRPRAAARRAAAARRSPADQITCAPGGAKTRRRDSSLLSLAAVVQVDECIAAADPLPSSCVNDRRSAFPVQCPGPYAEASRASSALARVSAKRAAAASRPRTRPPAASAADGAGRWSSTCTSGFGERLLVAERTSTRPRSEQLAAARARGKSWRWRYRSGRARRRLFLPSRGADQRPLGTSYRSRRRSGSHTGTRTSRRAARSRENERQAVRAARGDARARARARDSERERKSTRPHRRARARPPKISTAPHAEIRPPLAMHV